MMCGVVLGAALGCVYDTFARVTVATEYRKSVMIEKLYDSRKIIDKCQLKETSKFILVLQRRGRTIAIRL